MQSQLVVLVVIVLLGFIALAGMVGMMVLAYVGKTYGSELVAIVSGASGALASMLVSTRSEALK